MYIAIEGIKGSGKTTILDSLLNTMLVGNFDFSYYPITKKLQKLNKMEEVLVKNPMMKNNDDFLELLYYTRANINLKRIKGHSNFIIGDRSIITSYITRWDKWNDPYHTIKRVSHFTPTVPKPDIIIWISCNPALSYKYIKERNKDDLGKKYEEFSNLIFQQEVYEELFVEKFFTKKIKKSQLVTINNNTDIHNIKNEIFNILKFYYENNND
jgi:thymidylate kinase